MQKKSLRDTVPFLRKFQDSIPHSSAGRNAYAKWRRRISKRQEKNAKTRLLFSSEEKAIIENLYSRLRKVEKDYLMHAPCLKHEFLTVSATVALNFLFHTQGALRAFLTSEMLLVIIAHVTHIYIVLNQLDLHQRIVKILEKKNGQVECTDQNGLDKEVMNEINILLKILKKVGF